MEENPEYYSQSSDAESCSRNIQRLDMAIQQLIATWEVSHEDVSGTHSYKKDCNTPLPASEKSSWHSCIPYVQPQEMDQVKMLNGHENSSTLVQLDSHHASFNTYTKSTKRKMDPNQYLLPSAQACMWCRDHFSAHEPLEQQVQCSFSCMQCKHPRSNSAVDMHTCSKRPDNGQQHSWTFQENASQYYQYSCTCGFMCGDQLQLNLHRLTHMDFEASCNGTGERSCNVFNQKSSTAQLHVERGLGILAGQACAHAEGRHNMSSKGGQVMSHLPGYGSSYMERENSVCARAQGSSCMQGKQPFCPMEVSTNYMEGHAVKKVMASQEQICLGTRAPVHLGSTASVFMDRCKPQYIKYSAPERLQELSHKRSLQNAYMERQMVSCPGGQVQGCVRQQMLLPTEGNQRLSIMGQQQNYTETASSSMEKNKMIRIGSPSSFRCIKRYLAYNDQTLTDVGSKDKTLLEVNPLPQKEWQEFLIQTESSSSLNSSKQYVGCNEQIPVGVGNKDEAVLNVTSLPQNEGQECIEKDGKAQPHFSGPEVTHTEEEKLVCKHRSAAIKNEGQASVRVEGCRDEDKGDHTSFKTEQAELQIDIQRTVTGSPAIVSTAIKTEQAELQIEMQRTITGSPTVVTAAVKTEQVEPQMGMQRTTTGSPTVVTTEDKMEQMELQMDTQRTNTGSPTVVNTAVKTEQVELQMDMQRTITGSPTVITTVVKTEQVELLIHKQRNITESPTVVSAQRPALVSEDVEVAAKKVCMEGVSREGQAAVFLETQSNGSIGELKASEAVIPVVAKQQAVCNTGGQASLDRERQVVHIDKGTFINDEEMSDKGLIFEITLGQKKCIC